jgi:MinD-like ATPase involved in chromosome partitioning or flagellar assembly
MSAHSHATGPDAAPGQVVLAVGPTSWEPALLSALGTPALGLSITRRCVDAVEVLATVRTSTPAHVVVSSSLPRLDLNVISRLREAGCVVIGVTESSARADSQVLEAWAVDHIIAVDVDHMARSAAQVASVIHLPERALRIAPVPTGAASGVAGSEEIDPPEDAPRPARPSARTVVIWGPHGSVGRSSLAIGVADEIAQGNRDVLLIDADIDAPAIATMLAVVDPGPGLPVALRRAAAGRLDAHNLDDLCVEVLEGVNLLPGSGRPGHRSDLRSPAFGAVRRAARETYDVIVIDLGCAPLPVDGVGDQASLAVLDCLLDADEVLVVGGAGPIGVQRLVQSIEAVREARQAISVVVTAISAGSRAAREITALLAAHVGVDHGSVHFVAEDRAAYARILSDGLTLREGAARSNARADVRALAARVVH